MVGCQQVTSDGWFSAGHQLWLVVSRSSVMIGCRQVTSDVCDVPRKEQTKQCEYVIVRHDTDDISKSE
ncbi:hypothetical protein LSAT2_002430 [Lamellibrachia satsuma]|nr:hypothetical protein LSAT2_002430 [Lamellibrachia satsuma]